MGDIKNLKRDQEDVKTKLSILTQEFEKIRNKMAEKLDKDNSPNTEDVQHLSDTCDGLMDFKMETLAVLDNFHSKLKDLTSQVNSLSTAIDNATNYSYQYNLKLLGVPQENPRETAEETTELCLKVFEKIGIEVMETDIDIAHRIPSRNGRHTAKPIVCKFVRRIIREKVLSARANTDRLGPEDFDLPPNTEMGRIGIFSHLPPKLQDLHKLARTFQAKFQYKFCWAKSSAIFLRKSDNSRILKLECQADLEELGEKESTSTNRSARDLYDTKS